MTEQKPTKAELIVNDAVGFIRNLHEKTAVSRQSSRYLLRRRLFAEFSEKFNEPRQARRRMAHGAARRAYCEFSRHRFTNERREV